MIGEERNFGKFSCATCERPSPGIEIAPVAKTGAPLAGNTPREYPLWGGGGNS
jgi:hypothetical protein